MSEQTKITWCDSTLNFWSGCTKVSPGCANCYAEALSNRGMGNIGKWGKGAPRQLHESAFKLAIRLNKKPWICDKCGGASDGLAKNQCNCGVKYHKRRIFSLSLGDWLDDEVTIEWLARMLETIRQCDQVTWILCTKRPENFFERLTMISIGSVANTDKKEREYFRAVGEFCHQWAVKKVPPQNIILLASVESPDYKRRIAELLQIPAAAHGLSCEPLLADMKSHPDELMGLKWLIIGGESGPKARPCNVEWIRSLVAQGKAAGVATFVKQLGARPVENIKDARGGDIGFQRFGTITDKKGGDPAEWPEDLRVQKWPKLP